MEPTPQPDSTPKPDAILKPDAIPKPLEYEAVIQKKGKTKRGYGKKNIRKQSINKVNLSIIGTNAAGIKSKIDSFFSVINIHKPSIVTVQETKNTRSGLFKLPGYQTFEKVRKNKRGGGLLTAVDEDLNPVLISQCKDDIEILVVKADIGAKK